MDQEYWGIVRQSMMNDLPHNAWDHIKVVKDGIKIFPYQINKDDLVDLNLYCNKHNLTYFIHSKSEYKHGTLCIELKKLKLDFSK